MTFIPKKYVFPGYNLKHKGYKCLSSTGKVYLFASVKFDETDYPFKTDSTFGNLFKSTSFTLNQTSPLGVFAPYSNTSSAIDQCPELSVLKGYTPNNLYPNNTTMPLQNSNDITQPEKIPSPTMSIYPSPTLRTYVSNPNYSPNQNINST